MIKISIIYEDPTILVIDKPAGLTVNRAESVKEATVQDWMADRISLSENPSCIKQAEFINRGGLVHRLDKHTSGLMVLAKTCEAFENLIDQFKNRQVKKIYYALVHGRVIPKSGFINLPIKRNPLNRRRFTVKVDGRMSTTRYEVITYYPSLSYLRLFPKTGRTHQLRVHLQFLGHPIVSDSLYLGKRLKEDLFWCPRLFLHAYSLTINHPIQKKNMSFTSPLPNALKLVLNRMKSYDKK